MKQKELSPDTWISIAKCVLAIAMEIINDKKRKGG